MSMRRGVAVSMSDTLSMTTITPVRPAGTAFQAATAARRLSNSSTPSAGSRCVTLTCHTPGAKNPPVSSSAAVPAERLRLAARNASPRS